VSADESSEEEPRLRFSCAREWEDWLERNHASCAGVWIEIAKQGTGIESVRYPEVLDSAICFGWIDARRGALDERRFLQRFTPRRSRSRWSRVNRDKAEALIAASRMRPAGLAEVEAARGDGRWQAAYESQARAAVPDDLAAALADSPRASAAFAALSSQNRYSILYRLDEARRPETRRRRLEKFLAMLEAGETIHPQRRPTGDS
jgi:uncharacterized protein YdeI (YjbR/CyaY-like superfamily)